MARAATARKPKAVPLPKPAPALVTVPAVVAVPEPQPVPAPPAPATAPGIVWTPDQDRAFDEIMEAMVPRNRHLLTGSAGTGKTTLMQRVVRAVKEGGEKITVCAPTHKAVAVLARKLREAGIEDVDCRTIQSLLSLRPKADTDQLVFVRDRNAKPVEADVVVLDEASMLGCDLMMHIRRHLHCAVLFCGDPAQLPPVNEVASESFETKSRSHLETIVRQAADNPILQVAQTLRQMQAEDGMRWDWCRRAEARPMGVYLPDQNNNPKNRTDAWLKKAFTSDTFDKDPDSFRYLCWRNATVARINARVQRWRYGDLDTPFAPGERVLFRGTLVKSEQIIFNTNEEATVLEIELAEHRQHFAQAGKAPEWVAAIPSWRMKIRKDDGMEHTVHMPADDAAYNAVLARLVDEAKLGGLSTERWKQMHDYKAGLANLQAIYAMTIHTSQGSTFTNVFLDVPDVSGRLRDNPLETKQLLYVGATRPTTGLFLVGV